MAKIAAIADHDIHKITSSQVIIDLTTCVKELVDNSIDAHAHHIELTFKDYGMESIECCDDGDGINKDNFEWLALKHFTSKIKSFNDISSVETLGFRGEALASMCAVAHVSVTTTANPPRADKLEYDMTGALSSKSTTSRNKGTTILVSDLFYNLPVRKKEFDKNCKRQFTQCLALLQNYALIQEDIKMSVWNITSNKRKRLILSTGRCQEMPKKILSIFGSSSMRGLSPIHLELDLNSYKALLNKRHADIPTYHALDYKITVQGYISKSSFGCGRSAKDRQSLFINKRPIEYPALLKCCNEVYRTFNNVQYPTVFLNFTLSPILIDVNVTPDKRTVMLHNERYIIEVFRENLVQYYDKQEQVLPKSTLSQPEEPQQKRRRVASQVLEGDYYEDDESETDPNDDQTSSLMKRTEARQSGTAETGELEEEYNSTLKADEQSQRSNSAAPSGDLKDKTVINRPPGDDILQNSKTTADACAIELSDDKDQCCSFEKPQEKYEANAFKATLAGFKNSAHEDAPQVDTESSSLDRAEPVIVEIDDDKLDYQAVLTKDERLAFLSDGCSSPTQPSTKRKNSEEDEEEDDADYARMESQEVNVRFQRPPTAGLDVYRSAHRSLTGTSPSQKSESERATLRMKFEASQNISGRLALLVSNKQSFKHENSIEKNRELQDLEEGEKYMTLTVKKEDFREMQVVGQFNLGFIIVTRRVQEKYDLFIVDQHASDEKYNFEMLQASTVFKSQSLIAPLSVELSLIDELLVMDHIDVFEKNGFKVKIEEEEELGSKIKLLSLPVSKKTLFTVDDFYELVYLIKENGGLHRNDIRCSKVRSMFAMRACRSSIMIGKPLAMKTMVKVVRNLSQLDKPWNCPHGRPTMRHLMELKDWDSLLEDYQL